MKILTLILLLILSLQADRGLQLKKMQEEQRVALIIGNNNYEHLSNLKNPINDARAIRDALRNRGFSVIYKENATKRDMKKLVKKFTHQLSKGGVGMYYFAGHGINVNGINYLVATDSLMDLEDEVEFEALSLNYVLKKMKHAKNRLNIVVLDACRNNPFGRSGAGGLAPISNAKGIFVAYATEAGAVASDGKNGKNGLFTKHLIRYINEPGIDLAKVFKKTRRSVYDESDGKQSPGVYDQTLGEFFFTLPNTKKHNTIKKVKSTYSFKSIGPQQYTLNINTQPSDASITIDSSRNYYYGMKLKEGYYSIKISKSGYRSKTGEIHLQNDLDINIELEKIQRKKSYTPKKTSYKKTTVNRSACAGCHGPHFEKMALGKSKIVANMTKSDIAYALKGYKNGTYGGPLKGIMKGQVAKYSNAVLDELADTIGR